MTICTGVANLNFGTGQGKDAQIVNRLAAEGAVLIGVVEAKVDDLRAIKPSSRWRVAQDMRNNALKGSGWLWRNDVKVVHNRPPRIGVRPHGAKMLTRYLRILDIKLTKAQYRDITAHWPPKRYSFLWPLFTAHVKSRCRVTAAGKAGRWAVRGDFNQDGHKLAKKLGGTFAGTGIIGVIHGPGMRHHDLKVLNDVKARGWTDHPAVVVTLGVK